MPLRTVGSVHRATKTPATMHKEITKGEKPATTSFVGASAPPSHTPAARPQATPSPCSEWVTALVGVLVFVARLDLDQYRQARRTIPKISTASGIQNWLSERIALVIDFFIDLDPRRRNFDNTLLSARP